MDKAYPPKILLAWIEAIKGNAQIIDWLAKNGFGELSSFSFALRGDETARRWLMDNKFPHLMALINASEGDERALSWLDNNGYTLLGLVAKAAYGDERAQNMLDQRDKVFGEIARNIEKVIEDLNDQAMNKYRWN